MRRFCLLTYLVFTLVAALGASPFARAQCLVPPDHHPWGRFEVGSWKKVRVITENLDEQGRVLNTSEAETTTKLIQLDPTSYTLSIEVKVNVAGKLLSTESTTLRKGFSGERIGDVVKFEELGGEEVVVCGRSIPSQVRRIVIDGEQEQRITTIHYSEKFSPYVLRRESKSIDADGITITYASRGEVVVADLPYPIRSEIKTTSIIQTVHEPPKGKTVTTEVHSLDVPGGVVAHSSAETNENGQLVRKSRLELIDFEAIPKAAPHAPAQRKMRLLDRLMMRRGPR